MSESEPSIQMKIVLEMVKHSVRCKLNPDKLVAEGRIKRLSGAWYEILEPSDAEMLLSVASGTSIGKRTKVRLSKASLKRGRASIRDIRASLLTKAQKLFEATGETDCAEECRSVLRLKGARD